MPVQKSLGRDSDRAPTEIVGKFENISHFLISKAKRFEGLSKPYNIFMFLC